MSKLFSLFLTICFCVSIFSTTLYAQVNAIGTGVSGIDMSTSTTSFTTNNIAVPTASGRVLVVTTLTKNTANITSVEFNEAGKAAIAGSLAHSGGNSALKLSIYTIVLPTTAAANGTVTVKTDANSDFGVFVRTFENVDATNPVDLASNQFVVHTSGTDATVPSKANNMMIDIRYGNTAIGPLGAGQSDLAPALLSNQIRSSYKAAAAGTTTMSNGQPSKHLITALNFGPPVLSVNEGGNMLTNGATVDFGNAIVQSGFLSKTFTIKNTGNTTLTLTAGMPLIQIGGANAGEFVVTKGPTASLLAGATTSFTIAFDPSAIGNRTASVTIPTNAGTLSFQLAGNGVESIVPTMSQWGLLIFGLLIMNCGIWLIQERSLTFG